MENDEIVQNQERREKFRKWFDNALLPCRSDRGIVRMVGTILHLDSLLERLMPKDWDRRQVGSGRVVKTPLRSMFNTAMRRKEAWHAIRFRAHDPDFSNILWEEKWTKGRLMGERQRYIDAGNPEGYSQEYLNYPIDESFAYFRKSDFLPMGPEDKSCNKRFYIAVDLAVSELQRADYSVFVIGGMDDQGGMHIVNVIRERMDALAIVDMLFKLAKRYEPDMVAIESSLIEKSIGPFITEEMYKRNEYFPWQPMIPTKDKETRARSIQARMRAGGVKFDKEADWYSDLEQEMVQFPRSHHDDQVDAMAWLGLIVDKMASASTPKEMADEQYEDELRSSGLSLFGRSETTGY